MLEERYPDQKACTANPAIAPSVQEKKACSEGSSCDKIIRDQTIGSIPRGVTVAQEILVLFVLVRI